MSIENLKYIIEAALFAAGEPLTTERLQFLFEPNKPTAKDIHGALAELRGDYESRPLELVEVASGYRFQVRQEYANWLQRLWEKKPPRYSRALLETLALVAYRQPVTRGEIEDVRGVAINANIVRLLQEREWIKVVGYKDVPGKPALFGTTKQFLDYFNLKSLSELPSLQALMDMDQVEQKLQQQFALEVEGVGVGASEVEEHAFFDDELPEEDSAENKLADLELEEEILIEDPISEVPEERDV